MKAKIYNPAKTAMQSGVGSTKHWVFEYEQAQKRFINPLIGWIGSSDMNQEVSIRFDTKDSAIAYAEKNNIEYEVIEPKKRKRTIQAYADNFK